MQMFELISYYNSVFHVQIPKSPQLPQNNGSPNRAQSLLKIQSFKRINLSSWNKLVEDP